MFNTYGHSNKLAVGVIHDEKQKIEIAILREIIDKYDKLYKISKLSNVIFIF